MNAADPDKQIINRDGTMVYKNIRTGATIMINGVLNSEFWEPEAPPAPIPLDGAEGKESQAAVQPDAKAAAGTARTPKSSTSKKTAAKKKAVKKK